MRTKVRIPSEPKSSQPLQFLQFQRFAHPHEKQAVKQNPLLSQRGLWLSIAAIAVDDDLIKQVFGVFLDMNFYTVVEVLSFLLYSGHLLIHLNGIHHSDCKKNGASCR